MVTICTILRGHWTAPHTTAWGPTTAHTLAKAALARAAHHPGERYSTWIEVDGAPVPPEIVEAIAFARAGGGFAGARTVADEWIRRGA